MTSRRLALFDLDHTLLPLDTDYQWAEFLARTGRAGNPDVTRRTNEELMARYNAGELSAEQGARFMLGLLAAHTPTDLAQWREEFMIEVIRPAIKPQALALVQKHQKDGDLCALVTATNNFVAAPIARAFNLKHLLATNAEFIRGRYTGNIQGTPSFRSGKIVRVDQWLASFGLVRSDFERSIFYSDSTNDIPLLEQVTHPIVVNPSAALEMIAITRHWPRIDLFGRVQD